jgi:molecular chaperone DnaJ
MPQVKQHQTLDLANKSDHFSAFFGDDIFGNVAGTTRARQAQRGGDVAVELEIDLVEAAEGARREIRYRRAVACDTCGGNGARPGTKPVRCETCGGTGRLQQVSSSLLGQLVRTQTCRRCAGAGTIVEDPCEDCEGSGRTLEERTLDVDIPEGIHDGQRIRISGQGHAGALGGPPGDVYVHVLVRDDPRFQREGNDVYSTVNLTITQAALGATVTVPTLGGDVELEFPPGTQPGEIRVLRGRGMPRLQAFGRGDHRVLVNVSVPRHLTEKQRRLLEDFEASADDETYRHDEGFFDKLKGVFAR